jgi:hypothetical protein
VTRSNTGSSRATGDQQSQERGCATQVLWRFPTCRQRRRLHDPPAEAADTAIAAESVLAYRSRIRQDLSSRSRRQTPRPPARGAINSTPHRPSADRRVPHRVRQPRRSGGRNAGAKPYVGFGDRDLDLTGEPGLPCGLPAHARSVRRRQSLLLYCYSYEREAGHLARAFGNVYLFQRRPRSQLRRRPQPFPGGPRPGAGPIHQDPLILRRVPARPNSPTWRRGCGATPSQACSATGSSPTSGQTPTAAAWPGPPSPVIGRLFIHRNARTPWSPHPSGPQTYVSERAGR